MDSLLANYGSDEEDGNSPPGSPKPTVLTTSVAPAPIWNRLSLFGALPPPKNSASGSSSLWDDEEEPVKPLRKSSGDNNPERTAPLTTSFFTSLPPPKNSALELSSLWDDEEPLKRPKSAADRDSDPQQPDTARSLFTSVPPTKVENVWGEPLKGSARIPKLEPVGDEKVRKRQTGSLPSALLSPKLEPVTLPEGFFDNSGSLSDTPPPKDDTTEVKPSLLFARLPPPASSSKPSFAKLPLPSTTKRKQVVEFKPPINYALLETTEEDDELERSKKQSKLSKESDGAPERKAGVGLIALLPLPKNSLGAGAALGGGNSHGGRRTVMETASDPYRMANEVTSTSGSILQTVKKPEPNIERPPIGIANYEYGIEPAVQSSESYHYAQPDGGHYDPHLAQPLYAPGHSGSDGYSVGNGYVEKNWQNPDLNAFEVSQGQGSAPVHMLAEVMKKERRKGRDEPPPQMIEVKQADLTGGSKLREDQMRSTGIAFGPTYKPAASNKDKPSKIHRRKHQIGALYFDMKQNEMNLLDRRAKGNLTKAETQAKYGW